MRTVTWKEWDKASAEIGWIKGRMTQLQQLSLDTQEAITDAAVEGNGAHAEVVGQLMLTQLQEEYLQLTLGYRQVIERIFGERPKLLEPLDAFLDRISALDANDLLALMGKNGIQLERGARLTR